MTCVEEHQCSHSTFHTKGYVRRIEGHNESQPTAKEDGREPLPRSSKMSPSLLAQQAEFTIDGPAIVTFTRFSTEQACIVGVESKPGKPAYAMGFKL